MSSDLFNKLYEEFDPAMIKKLKKGGANLSYIPVSEVVTRLNRVFGVDGWGVQVIRVGRDDIDTDFIVAHVRLTVQFTNMDGAIREIYRDGMGGQKINRNKQGEPVDLGDDHKGAVSDAIKKAASTFGIGLHLARDEEAIYAEEAASVPAAPVENPDPEVDKAYVNFLSQVKVLDDDQKAELNKFWATFSGGRPKPSRQEATKDDVEALSGEAIRLALGATEEA